MLNIFVHSIKNNYKIFILTDYTLLATIKKKKVSSHLNKITFLICTVMYGICILSVSF